MFSKNSKAYSVYLLFRFVYSLAASMATVLSIVYHLEVVQLDAFQLVLVGTVLETSCFLFEIPTGVVADLYSRRRSVLIGMFLYGLGFLMEGALPWFATVLLAQVVWGCGDTFITGALEAWIASEEEDKPMDKVFLRGVQMGQIGGVLGVVLGTLLGNINLQMPIILGGSLCLLLGLVLVAALYAFSQSVDRISSQQHRKGHVLPDAGRYALQRAGGRERNPLCLLPCHSHCRSPVPQLHDGKAFSE